MSNQNSLFIRGVKFKNIFIIIIIFLLILLTSCNKDSAPKEEDKYFNTGSTLTTIKIPEEINVNKVPTETSIDEKSIPYYQIQLEIVTDSDWSELKIINVNDIYAVQLENTAGNFLNYSVKRDYLQEVQSIEAAKQNKKISMTVNYAISPDALSNPINFKLNKGGLNGTYISIYYINGDKKQLIQKVEHVGIVKNDSIFNTKEFNLDLSKLKDAAPKIFKLKGGKTGGLKKMVWAFYYPWYDLNDWSSNEIKDRPKILYASDNPDSISNQIDQAKSAGIDGFISSWSGPGSLTDNNLKTILDIAKEKGFLIAIHFETQSDKGPREKDEIFQWLKYIIISYGNHPAYAKVNGKPLIIIYDSSSILLETWKSIFEKLKKEGYEATFIGMGYGIENLDVFDGVYEYNIFDLQNLLELYKKASQDTKYYQMIKDLNAPKIFAATVMPGYDERSIPGRKGGFQDRENGAFYKKTFETAIASDPDYIFITSWNEWWEDTQIEPSELYGDEYLNITKEYVKLFK
jgi:hypothetical protein